MLNHRGTENTEVAQRNPLTRVLTLTPQQSIIETLGVRQLGCAREFLLDHSLAFCSHRSGAFRILEQRDESFGHQRIITRRHEITSFTVSHDLASTTNLGYDHGSPRSHI